jgi:hypothetical protein
MPTPHLGLPLIAESQAGKADTHNLALAIADALIQLVVINETTTAPPGSPSDGDCYIIGATHTGDWAAYAQHDVAIYISGTGWINRTPSEGWLAFNQTTNVFRYFTGAAWANL